MIRLVRPLGQVEFPGDVAAIRAAMNALGYDASDSDIAWAYADWSEDIYSAGWMSLDSFADISGAVMVVIERLEDAG